MGCIMHHWRVMVWRQLQMGASWTYSLTDVGVCSSDMDKRVFYASNISLEMVIWRIFVWR